MGTFRPANRILNMSPKYLVVIPTYNELDNITKLIPIVLSQDPGIEVLVVDDGSPDGTGQMVDNMAQADPRIHVLHRAGKMGLGTAYLTGFRWALDRSYTLIIEMDADFSHDPQMLVEFLKASKGADLVIGSRYMNKCVNVVNWPIGRLFLSYGANIYARLITGLPVFDATGGFKCFRREVLEKIDFAKVRSNGYAFQIEMNFRAWKKGAVIKEIPIVFVDRTSGQSKMSKKIMREAVWMVWRLRLLASLGRI